MCEDIIQRIEQDSKDVVISIVMPVYNAENVIGDTIESILKQSFKEFELICVNDGSTDNTKEILEEYAERDKRIKVFSKSNQGAGMARNYGLEIAEGEYIIFLDSDDVFDSNMLQIMFDESERNNLDVVICRSDEFSLDVNYRKSRECCIRRDLLPEQTVFCAEDVETNFFLLCVWWPWDKLFRRSFIIDTGLSYQNLRTTNDLFFVVCAVLESKRIKCIDDVLVHQRVNNNKSLSATREKSWDCFMKALDKVKDYMESTQKYERFQQDYLNYVLRLSLWNLETLRGEAFERLFHKLKYEYFPSLKLYEYSENFYYDKYDYDSLVMISNNDYESYLLSRYDTVLEILRGNSIEFEGKDRIISDKVREIECKDKLISDKTKEIECKDKLISDKAEEIECKDRIIFDKTKEIEDIDKMINDMTKELEHKDMIIATFERQLEELRHSLSYRLGRAITWLPRKFVGRS